MGAEQDAQGFVHLGLNTLENRLHILFAQCIPLFNSSYNLCSPQHHVVLQSSNIPQESLLVSFADRCVFIGCADSLYAAFSSSFLNGHW